MRCAIVFALLAAASVAEAAHARRAQSSCSQHRRHHHKAQNLTAKTKKKDKHAKHASHKKPAKSAAPSAAPVAPVAPVAPAQPASSQAAAAPLPAASQNASMPSAPAAAAPANVTGASVNSTTGQGKSGLTGVNKYNVFLGFLPDEGDAGGPKETMAELNSWMGSGKAATYGQYAQAQSGTTFTGGQLLNVMQDVVSSGAIFEPAVMPTGGWQGLTSSDNSQALAICGVLKQFTDQGVEVRLRFAHEANYYQTDGTYTGGPSDFIEGWNTVTAACKQVAPAVKMFWTPNVANMAQYQQYTPGSWDFCGVDFYPQSLGDNTFVSTMKQFHDYCTANGAKFAIGETGLGYAGPVSDRLSWLNQIMSSQSQLPNLVSVSWFNYMKGYDFRILDSAGGSATDALLSWLA